MKRSTFIFFIVLLNLPSLQAQPYAFKTTKASLSTDTINKIMKRYVEVPDFEKHHSSLLFFFRELGVTFPEGSYFSYDPDSSQIIISNNRNNLELIFDILSQVRKAPRHVRISVSLVSFKKSDLVHLAQGNTAAYIDSAQVLKLQQAGKGTLIQKGQVTTTAGQNVQWGITNRVEYPTEYRIGISGQVETKSTVDRHTGLILNFTPKITSDRKTINLDCFAEYCTNPDWIDYGFSYMDDQENTHKIPLKQPVFNSWNVTTSIALKDGATWVVGGTDPGHSDAFRFFFITPQLIRQNEETVRAKFENDPAALRLKRTWANWVKKPDPATGMVTRSIPLDLSTFHLMFSRHKTAQATFAQYGVEFIPGAFIKYDTRLNLLIVRHTRRNLDSFTQVTQLEQRQIRQVEVDAAFIAFKNSDLAPMLRAASSAAPNQTAIRALWKEGKGELLSYTKLMTQTGLNAIWESVSEIIYPSEFEDFLEYPKHHRPRFPGRIPGSFETREVGMTLNVTPTVGPDGRTIELTLSPEYNPGFDWGDYSHNPQVPMPQPYFQSRNLTTSIVAWDGATLVQGGHDFKLNHKTVYLFLTARTMNNQGKALRQNKELE